MSTLIRSKHSSFRFSLCDWFGGIGMVKAKGIVVAQVKVLPMLRKSRHLTKCARYEMPCKEIHLNSSLELIKGHDSEGLRETKAFASYNELSSGYYVSVTVKHRLLESRVN